MADSSCSEPLDVRGIGSALGLSDRASGSVARQLAQQAVASLSSDGRWLALACRRQYTLVELPPDGPPRLHAHQTLVTVPGTQEAVTAAALLTLPGSLEDGLPRRLLLLGSSRGYLHVAAPDGRPLLRERLHEGACCSIALDGGGSGPDALPRGVTLGFGSAVARVDTAQLLDAAHAASQQARGTGGLTPGALRCTKWELPKAAGPRSQAVCVGRPTPPLYDCLAGRTPAPALLFLTAGRAPAVACLEAAEAGGAGVLGLVSDLAAGVGGVARTLVRGRPDGFRAGLGSWLGRLSGGGGAAADGAEIPSPKAAPGPGCALGAAFDDEPREVLALLPAPWGALAAAADSLGRVLLLDTACLAVVRVWKAYRSAQLAWIALPQSGGEESGHSQALLLALYSPKRGLLEVWRPRLGPRLCSWPRGRAGRLLAPAAQAAGGRALRPLFLDCESGIVEDVAALAAAELGGLPA